ncbi:GIY-YIG nuclease family protein [Halomicroarcula sp. GCM10025709]|uniref:GIY-YIG nuclease family protein n=1 Tax=Halomicroarcula sp. GCM10025709 TaxID=3252669 RepID=UPI003617EA1A
MPIKKNWSRANSKHINANVPTKGEFTSSKPSELVYIGKTSNLRRRLLEHLNERNPNYYRFKKAGFLQSPSGLESEHLEAYGTTQSETPSWNERFPRA